MSSNKVFSGKRDPINSIFSNILALSVIKGCEFFGEIAAVL